MPEISGVVNIWDRTVHLDNGTRTDENGKQLQWPNWQPETPITSSLVQKKAGEKWNYQTGAHFDAFSGTWKNPDGTIRTQNDKVISDKNQLEMMKMPKDFYDPPAPVTKLTQTSYPGVRVPWDEPAPQPWHWRPGSYFDSFDGAWHNHDGTRTRQDGYTVTDAYQIKAMSHTPDYYGHAQISEPLGDPPKNENLKPYLEYTSTKQPPLDSKYRSYDGQAVDPKETVYPSLAQQKEFPDLDKKPNEPPYLTHEHDPNLPPLGSKFHSYDGKWYNPDDIYTYKSLAQAREFPDLDKLPNDPPYLTYKHDTNLPPLGSKFRSYDGQWYDPDDIYTYKSLAQWTPANPGVQNPKFTSHWKPNSEKQIWEEPTLHEYPYFNPYTGAVHNVDGSRTYPLEGDKTITSQPLIDFMYGSDPKTAGPYPPKKQVASLAQQDYPYFNSPDGVWQNPDGSKTRGSGPTWVNPNGVRQDNYERDIPTQRPTTDVN